MIDVKSIKEEFLASKLELFSDRNLLSKPLEFCINYSLLVEEFIRRVVANHKINFAIVSGGSFSRRELSPFSDIDLMFLCKEIHKNEDSIRKIITDLWDCGIEVSHTTREFSDIEKFLNEDLHSFTQFFETRFLIGSEKLYNEWNVMLFSSVNPKSKKELILEYFNDTNIRHEKYGGSSKILEPNIKFSAGGLRDLHTVEWIYSLKNDILFTEQNEITQTENFLNHLKTKNVISNREINYLLDSFKFLINVRTRLHLIKNRKDDRLEFTAQEKISSELGEGKEKWKSFMRNYFHASNIIFRFTGTMMKRFEEEIFDPLSDTLAIELDDDFFIKGKSISIKNSRSLSLSDMMRLYYYRGLHDGIFDQSLRSLVIDSIQNIEEQSRNEDHSSSVFFREILKLPKNVGKTLNAMNELGLLAAYLPEFKEIVGFFQPGVYHCYTTDEHTLIALKNLEKLQGENSHVGKIFSSLKEKDLIYLAILFHDIGKPISLSGHEIIGAEIANSIMEYMGYDAEEISLVQFLVRHHLTMEQVAFRRNINDAATLNSFASLFPSAYALDLLFLLTYADLSAVSQHVWTQWKSDLLFELFRKTKILIEEGIRAEDLLRATKNEILNFNNSKNNDGFKEHVDSIEDIGYFFSFSQDEINQHIKEIEGSNTTSLIFKQEGGFTNITIITVDSDSLLSKLCGALSINDLNIHDAKIFTRRDGIVIDSFNVTDYRTHKPIDESRFDKIKKDVNLAVRNELKINKEFLKVRNKWWRIESKLFSKKSKIKISFEKHEKYTIIDVHSADKLGLLYEITKKMNELGLVIYFAKIGTKADDVVDAFYVLDRNKRKISHNQYELIRTELTQILEEMI
ncbi:MAG: [protein-PII] uridylyltransferase [Ignavibacteriae bacterium]|nr:[protein-PII] uridylyltransferase [Ignavibacteriota bacterium]